MEQVCLLPRGKGTGSSFETTERSANQRCASVGGALAILDSERVIVVCFDSTRGDRVCMSACTQYNETRGRTREVIGYRPSTAQEETECAGEGRERERACRRPQDGIRASASESVLRLPICSLKTQRDGGYVLSCASYAMRMHVYVCVCVRVRGFGTVRAYGHSTML